jgi:type II secretory pathway pseudopilin PulG
MLIPGMTLLELTVVIVVLIGFIAIMFAGASAWKRGSDRAFCVLNIRDVQNGMRAYSNLSALSPGSSTPGLRDQIIGAGRFVQSTPICPSGGTYIFGPDEIPPFGTLYMKCSAAASLSHEPTAYDEW